MATDPPYLVNYDGGNHPPTWANGGKSPGAPPDAATKHWDTYVDHETAVQFYEEFLTRGTHHGARPRRRSIYMFFAMMRAPLVFAAWEKAGCCSTRCSSGTRPASCSRARDYCWNYEPIAYGWVKGSRPRAERRPPANATAVWEIASAIIDGPQEHPTCKPVELMRRPIEYHTKPGELIYEPFCGSGTAIIAAETDRPALLRPRALPDLLRRRRTTLGGIYRTPGDLRWPEPLSASSNSASLWSAAWWPTAWRCARSALASTPRPAGGRP